MNYKLSDQAVGALMMALQKGIMEEIDITDLVKDFVLIEGPEGLIVENPPIVHADSTNDDEKTEEANA